MKPILFAAATLQLASNLHAQTLSISSLGEVRLNPPPARLAELYESDSPHSQEWSLVGEFTEMVQVDTSLTRFYRARIKAQPLKLVRILETNQTLRGSVDKLFTNITLTVNGITNQGWAFGSERRLGTNGTKMPVTTRMDFAFPKIPVTNTTPGLLTIWDEDGFVLTTNLWIGTGTYKPLLPRWYKPPTNSNAITPASLDPQTQIGWGLVAHSASSLVAVQAIPGAPCQPSYQSSESIWDANGWWLKTDWTECRDRKLEKCGATYSAAAGGTGLMFRTSEYGTNCPLAEERMYSAKAEVGSYNSDTALGDMVLGTHYEHSGNSQAEMWIGGRLRGAERGYFIIIGMSLETPIERLGGNQLFWGPASPRLVSTIGGTKTSRGKIAFQVPDEGILLDVTPTVQAMSSGWYLYFPTYQILSSPESFTSP